MAQMTQMALAFMTLVLSVLIAIFAGLTWRGQAKPPRKATTRRTQQLTWRLFISPETGMNSTPITTAALRTAMELEFNLSLAGSRLVLARERDRYCATLSSQKTMPPFENEKKFALVIDVDSGEKLYTRYGETNTSSAQGTGVPIINHIV